MNNSRILVACLWIAAGCTTPTIEKSETRMPSITTIPVSMSAPANTRIESSVKTENTPNLQANQSPQSDSRKSADPKKDLYIGSGNLLKRSIPRPPGPAGDIRFNFENTDVREVVKSILGDTLQENYLVDPAVTGAVTLRTSKGISRNDLIPILEVILRQANAILVRDNGLWRVQPAAAGIRGAGKPTFLRAPGTTVGYGVTLMPLQHIGVNEMMRMLDAVVKEPTGQGGAGGSVRAEPLRNMIIIAGTQSETQHILDTIEMFDVDWMSGMSAGLFTLEHSEAKKVLEEVDKVLGGLGTAGVGGGPSAQPGLGPLFGLVRVQLIERLNAILVISPRPDMISQAETWIRRLDRGGSADSSRFYVYNLQYTSAEKLAPVLQQAMQGRSTSNTSPAATAPGQNPLTISTPVAIAQSSPTTNVQPVAVPARVAPSPATGAVGQGGAVARNAVIIADKDRNALLIVASPAEFSAIEAAIKKLDILPRQVMVEVTVVEVDLTDEFALGVEWAASRNANVGTSSFSRWADSSATVGSGGISFGLKNRDVAGNILNLLNATFSANDGNKRARIHASPKLMAVDNTPVTFNVGRSVSVQTSTVTTPGTTSTTNSTSNTYQYLQTGISVSITPRISAGGLVNLEITQEISEPTSAAVAGNPNPDISKTALKNTVLAQDGETIVMAGLIREKISDNSNGLPGLSRIPFLGGLAGRQSYNVDKQELLVLVRPVVISTIEQARDASDEIRNKMKLLKDSFSVGEIAAPPPVAFQVIPQPFAGSNLTTSPAPFRELRISPELGEPAKPAN
jgi:general secretion pathway protein D